MRKRPFLILTALLAGALALSAQPRPGGGMRPPPPGGGPPGAGPGFGGGGGGGGGGRGTGGGMGQGDGRGGGRGGQQQGAQEQYAPEDLCNVSGIVRSSATGEPLSKASITLNAGGGRSRQSYTASTSADGRFSFPGIEPGQYRISVRRNGYVATEMTGRRSISPAQTLNLAKRQSLSNIEAKLIPHAVITGRVFDSDGEPVVYASVQLSRTRFNQQGQRELADVTSAITNDLGEYRLFGIPPGRYVVGVQVRERVNPFAMNARAGGAAGSEGPVPTFYPGAPEVSQATPIDIAMGTSVQGIDVRVLRAHTFSISGHVSGSQASSDRRDGMVMLMPANRAAGSGGSSLPMRGMPTMGPIRSDGKFTIRGVPEGSYELVAESFGQGGRMQGTAQVQVGSRDVDNAEIAMQPAFDIAGSIRLEGKESPESLQSAVLNLQQRDRSSRFGGAPGARPGVDGHFLLRQMLPGHFDVNVSGLPENHYVKSVRAGETDALASGARIMAGMQLDIVVSPNGGRVEGSVTNDKGEVVANGSAILLAKEGSAAPLMRRYRTAGIDQQGHFSFSGIAPGDYQLLAVDETDSGVVWDPEFLKLNAKLIESISLRESASEQKPLKLIVTGQ